MVEPLALIDSDFRQNDSEVVAKSDKNKVKPSLEFLNSQELIKKFLSLPRRDESVKSSYTCAKAGFTLAEVLITLGIIGVVAAMTIPNLMTSYKAHRYRSQFLKSYSMLQQVIRRMIAEDVSTEAASYKAREFYKEFQKYLSGVTDNGTYFIGFTERGEYHTYNKKNWVRTAFFDDGILSLNDGTTLYFENPEKGFGASAKEEILMISVDINGYSSEPNIWGVDLFTFQISDGELLPMGAIGTVWTDQDSYCSDTSTLDTNGIACTVKAKDNPEYFKSVLK